MNEPTDSELKNSQYVVRLPHRLIKLIAWGGTAALILTGMLVALVPHFSGERVPGARFFQLTAENNLPTWFSSTGLLTCAVLLTVISVIKRREGERWWTHWAVLAVLFTLLSIDEAASLHENLFTPLRGYLGLSGIFWYAWVIPGTIFVAVFALAFARFLLHLPRRLGLLFILSGVIYVSGALLMEMAGSHYSYNYGKDNLTYTMLSTIEECMEMVGVTLFLTSLLNYLAQWQGRLAIAFRSQKT